jgi:hypothetical protein
MPTTYIFGAGASLHAGYPLASAMGKGLLDFMLSYPVPPYAGEAQFVIDSFGKSSNIEDVITSLQSRIDSLESVKTIEAKAERTRVGNCLGFLNASIREWFRDIHTKPAPTYAEFAAKVVQPGDMVITFNYDDSLERELRRVSKWDISRGYGFPLGNEELPSDVLVLKLHGSMNWLVSLFGGIRSGFFQMASWPLSSLGDRPVIHPADLEHLGHAQFSGHTFQGGGAFPCLILPGRKKQFFYGTSFGHEFGDFWELLWSQAADAVKRSERIVLCGYSLLPVDRRACELLLREPKKEAHVSIVCGSQSERIANDFREAGFRTVDVFAGGYFEDWVQAEVKRSVSATSPF